MSEKEMMPPPTPIEVRLPAPQPRTKGEREYEAFKKLLPQLLTSHWGKFVAVHEGRVVDSDTDDIALIERVHREYGYVPIYVGFVVDPPPPPIRIPHYRLYTPPPRDEG